MPEYSCSKASQFCVCTAETLAAKVDYFFFFTLVLHIIFQLCELVEHICATWEQTSMKS